MRDFTGVAGASGGTAVSGTRWTPEVANSLVGELVNVITHEDGGDTPLNPADDSQLRAAILAMIARGAGASYTEGFNETTISFGAVRLKIGSIVGGFAEQLLPVYFETPFETKCWGVLPVVLNTAGNLSRDTWPQLVSYYAGGFTVALNFSGGGQGTAFNNGVLYVAFGR